MFLSGDLCWGVVDEHTLPGIDGHIRNWQRQHFRDCDFSHAVIMDAKPLLPRPINFLGIVNFDFLNQLVEHPGRELTCAGVLSHQRDEHIRGHGLAALLLDFGAEFFDFLHQLFLLVLIPSGHFRKTVIGELAGNIVLIDAFKQSVQFFVSCKQGFQFLLLQLAVGLRRLLGVPDHRFQKFVLIEAGELRQAPYLAKHHLFQKIHSDIVGGSTAPTVALIVGAVEILDLRVSLIEVEVKVAAAVGTDQQAGEHIVLAFVGAALADFSPLLLYLLKYGPFDDRLVDVLEDDPIFTVILQPLFVLVGFRIGLEVENVAAILLQRQDFGYGGTVPLGNGLLLALSGALDALFQSIGTRGKDFIPFKLRGDLRCPVALQGYTVNPPNHLGGFIVHNPSFRIVGVFDVTMGRLAHRFTCIPLDLVADTPFLADVAGVPLIEQVADRRQLALALGGVDIVGYRHQANVMLREKFLGQPADLDVVTAQAGKVFLCQVGTKKF